MTPGRSRRWVTIASYVVAFHALLAYGLPGGVLLLLAVTVGILYARVGAMGAVAVTFTLATITLLYSLALTLTGFDNAIYFRPDERLSTFDYRHNHRIFRPGARLDMRMPQGDLQSMTSIKIAEPRDVHYRIDSYGFRNDADYQGQKYLLVGDSFVVGTGNTQSDMISAQLAQDYGLATYNLAHPGDVPDYAQYVAGFKASHSTEVKLLVFIFEGNDFVASRTKKRSAVTLFFKRYSNLFSDTNVFRVTRSLYARAKRSSQIADSEYLIITTLQGKKIAFLKRYAEVTRQVSQPPIESFERALADMGPNIERIFFIPTKYRVYHKYVDPGTPPPNAAWQYLHGVCRKNNLKCTNLTQPLIKATDELLAQGEMTWWRDDTHWNRNGMAVAARVVAETLKVRAPARPVK